MVCGPQTVGKTRLAEELPARAVAAGWRAGWATTSAAASSVTPGALAHLLPTRVGLSGRALRNGDATDRTSRGS